MSQQQPLPPEGVGGLGTQTQSSATAIKDGSDQLTVTPKGLGGRPGDLKEMRSFAQILADEKSKRNILEIKLRKVTNFVENELISVKM